MRTIAFLLLTIYFVSLGVESRRRKEKDDGKIIGGASLSITDAPYQVSIQNEKGEHLCGGTLIKDNWVLTAAHCLEKRKIENIKLRAGSSRYADGGQELSPKNTIMHSQYNSYSLDNDVGLIELETPITETDTMRPIALAKKKPHKNVELLVTGWGDTQENSKLGSDTLQYIKVSVFSEVNCQNLYRDETYTSNMFCAGIRHGGQDACQGDSGGPAVADNKLFGIISWGNGCGRIGRPGVYVIVANYREWIKEKIKDNTT